MTTQRGGANVLWLVPAAALLLVSACAPHPPHQTATEQAPSEVAAFASPSVVTTPDPTLESTPASSPSTAMSQEQTAAVDTVLEFFRLRNEIGRDPELDFQPMADITTGMAQEDLVSLVDQYELHSWVQTGDATSSIVSVGPVLVQDDQDTVEVVACVDSTDVDIQEVRTGDSVKPMDSVAFVEWKVSVIHDGDSWKVRDSERNTVENCSP